MKSSKLVTTVGVAGLCIGLAVSIGVVRFVGIHDPWTPFVVGIGGGLGYVLADGVRRRRSNSKRKNLR